MKRIEAIIQPHQFEAVQKSLTSAHVNGVTVSEVRGFGHQGGKTHLYRGAEYSVEFLPKIQLTILTPEDQVDTIVAAIQTAAYTGKIGDGKIFVMPVEDVIRIRTGEHGRQAL